MVGSEIKDIISGTESFGSAAVMIVLIGLMGWWTFRTYKKAAQRGKKGSRVWGWILIAIGVIGYLGSFDTGSSIDSFCVACGFVFSGVMLLEGFSKKVKKTAPKPAQPARPVPQPQPVKLSLSEQVIALIDQTLSLPRVKENPEFSSNLRDSRDFIIETVKKSGETAVGKQLMTTISNLLSIYLDTADNAIQTDQTQKNLLQIENAFVEVRKALASLYDKTYSSENIDLSAEITAMNMMLKQDGLLGSDFEPSGGILCSGNRIRR